MDIPIFKDIWPEDIEDVTSRYRAYLGAEFETDTVKNVGYLFENAEKMDIQAERQNTREARERAELAEKKAETAEKKLGAVEARAGSAKKRVADMADAFRRMLSGLIGLCREDGFTKKETRARLHDYYRVSELDLEKYFESAWQGN